MAAPDNRGESLEKLSLAAAMARSYARDQQGFATLIAMLLEESVPEVVEIERKPVRLFSSEKRVTGLKVTLGDEVFELIDPGHNRPLAARKIKIVRGITLKTEQLPIHTWLEQLEAAVTEYAHGNESTSEAIADFLHMRGL